MDLSVVGALLTHKNAATTQRYAYLRPDAVKQAAATTKARMSGFGAGLNLPPGLNLPF